MTAETASIPPAPVKKKSWRRRFGFGFGILAAVLLLLRLALAFLFSPQALVDRLEAEMNARVEIGSVSLSLFSSPARVEMRDVRFGERDVSADNALKLKDRPAMERSILSASSLKLAGSPWSLLKKEFNITEIVIDQAGADIRVRETGGMNLTKLFRTPEIVGGKPNPKIKFKPIVSEDPVNAGAEGEAADPPMKVDDVPFAASIKSFLITGARAQALFKKSGRFFDVSDLRFEVTDLDVDPANLATRNKGRVRISGSMLIAKPEESLEYARLHILGEGDIIPFDPATRAMNPTINGRLTFGKESVISYLPSLAKINKKLETLKKVGINIGDKLGTSVDLPDENWVDFEYSNGVFRMLTPLHARAQKIEIEVEPGGYIHTATNDHFFRVILVGNQTLSDRMRAQVVEKADVLPSGKARDEFLKELMDSFFLDGRFRPICVSSGEIGDPEVELENKMPDLGKYLKGVLGDIGIDPETQKDLEEAGSKLLESLLKRNK
ncbi:MAG: hypothetical protein ACKO2G_10215 [Verrucomicrobiales bacterium]